MDALRNETLLRYDKTRLEQIKMSKTNNSLKGVASCYEKNSEEGLNQLYNITEKNKSNPIYWNHVGTCFYLKGEFAKAKMYYELSLNLSKTNKEKSMSLNNLGLIYLSQKHERMAYDIFKKALTKDPTSLTSKYNLLQVCIQFSLIGQAEKIALELHQRGRKDIDFTHSLATVYNMKGDYKKAISLYKNLPEKFLARADINNSYSLSLYQSGDIDGAQKIMNKRELITTQAKVVSAIRELERNVKRTKDLQR